MLTASLDKTAWLWEAESGKLLATFRGHINVVNRAVFSPDGWMLLPSQQRPVDPYGTTTQEQAADMIIRPGISKDEVTTPMISTVAPGRVEPVRANVS